MASNPQCCLTAGEWQARFAQWIEHGAPQDLLSASIYFDLRPIAGQLRPGASRCARCCCDSRRACRVSSSRWPTTRCANRAPLDWLGALDTRDDGDHRWLDLKLRGTALFVDAARLYTLAHGIDASSTRSRLTAAAQALKAPALEGESWVAAFEFLQMLRLRVQLDEGAAAARPNEVDVAAPEPDRPPRAEGERARGAQPAAAHRAGLSAVTAASWLRRLAARRTRAPADARRWVVLDVEASGLDAARDRLLAIAAIGVHVADDRAQVALADSFEVVLRQPDDAAPPDKPNILLHGIGVGAQRNGVEPAQALDAFTRFVCARTAAGLSRRIRSRADRARLCAAGATRAAQPLARSGAAGGGAAVAGEGLGVGRLAGALSTSAVCVATTRPPMRWPPPNCCCTCGRCCEPNAPPASMRQSHWRGAGAGSQAPEISAHAVDRERQASIDHWCAHWRQHTLTGTTEDVAAPSTKVNRA